VTGVSVGSGPPCGSAAPGVGRSDWSESIGPVSAPTAVVAIGVGGSTGATGREDGLTGSTLPFPSRDDTGRAVAGPDFAVLGADVPDSCRVAAGACVGDGVVVCLVLPMALPA
jgi:hypothetical protein